MRRSSIVPASSYRVFPGGVSCTDARPGSLVLVRHDDLMARAIREVVSWRVPEEYCWTNHACTTVTGGPDAIVTQEEARGDVLTPLSGLHAVTYAVVDIECSDEQRAAAVEFARWAVDSGYGFTQIGADLFNSATGLELSLGVGNRMVCSTQATRTAERQGYVPARTPAAVTPPHLAMDFGVTLP